MSTFWSIGSIRLLSLFISILNLPFTVQKRGGGGGHDSGSTSLWELIWTEHLLAYAESLKVIGCYMVISREVLMNV